MHIELRNLECGLMIVISKVGMTYSINTYFENKAVDIQDYVLTKDDMERLGNAIESIVKMGIKK